MAKYQITIKKIETKMVKAKNWVEVDPYKNGDGKTVNHDYRIEEKEEEVSEIFYEQKRDDEIDLPAIIAAFNKK